jgi:hypothetical protein
MQRMTEEACYLQKVKLIGKVDNIAKCQIYAFVNLLYRVDLITLAGLSCKSD